MKFLTHVNINECSVLTINPTQLFAVKPLNSGHIGGRTLVHYREVVPISDID